MSRAESGPPSPFGERSCQRKFTPRGILSATEGGRRVWPQGHGLGLLRPPSPEGRGSPEGRSWESQPSVSLTGRLTFVWATSARVFPSRFPPSTLTFVSQSRLSDAVWAGPREAPTLKHQGYTVLSHRPPLTEGVPVDKGGCWEIGSWREVGPPFQEPQVPSQCLSSGQEVWSLVRSWRGHSPSGARNWIWKSRCPDQNCPFRNS